ncbi:TraR/DksA C4-type zinc finger protein [Candidatus Poribacteria bacterium]|nr:TraR/DksA C4-type zinc finger protein [Candidatus Poribacteria bacterium]
MTPSKKTTPRGAKESRTHKGADRPARQDAVPPAARNKKHEKTKKATATTKVTSKTTPKSKTTKSAKAPAAKGQAKPSVRETAPKAPRPPRSPEKSAPVRKPVARPAAAQPEQPGATAAEKKVKLSKAATAARILAAATRSVAKAARKGPAKPKEAAPAAEPEAPRNGGLNKTERLAKLLAIRAKDTRAAAVKAAVHVKKATNNTGVPTSVAKAAEFAETRKISTLVKKPAPVTAPEPEEETVEPAKKKRRRKAPYTRTEIREIQEILESERQRLIRDLDVINEMATSSEGSMSHSFSNHQADAATDSSALETTFMTRRYEEERLSQVVYALERLARGDFGLCEMCDDYIPIGRLRAKPFAKLCVTCRTNLEKHRR